jgi:hypothetical protein
MWIKGHIKPIWDHSYKNYNYTKKSLPEHEIKKWRALGYNHTSFNGEMFNDHRSVPFWSQSIANKFQLINPGFVFYKMKTNDIMPVHSDHYETYIKIFNADKNKIWRLLVLLEDWKSGHYLEIDNTAIVNWKAGDYVFWNSDVPHAASNIGIEDRYTLQITGTLDDSVS